MKNRQLLSVVFSLIMFTGVTAGNAAFAESDELDDVLERYCEMTIEEQSDIILKYELDEYAEKLATICDIEDKDQREESLESVIDAVYIETDVEDETKDEVEDETDDESDEYYDDARDGKHFNLDDRLAYFCSMSDDETRQFFVNHPRLAQFSDRLANICDMSEDERPDKLRDFIREHVSDEDRDRNIDVDFREKLTQWCAMSDDEKSATAIEFGKTEDQIAKADRYCALDESDRANFIDEHRDEFREHMKARMMDKPHMDYERLCVLSESERAAEIDDSEKLEKISKWCDMSTEERDDYKKESHDAMKDKHEELREKFSEQSDRIKSMIMDKRDISDERHDEIKMKYEEKFGEDSDKKRTEIKMKYKDHMLKMKFEMSDDRKSDVHDRVAEMKAYKAELREKSSELTDKEKQLLREEFIQTAKDMQLAWISPRTQMTAGVDSAEVECREGFSLVMKASNGVAMCLKADTALKMIDRGIVVVPTN